MNSEMPSRLRNAVLNMDSEVAVETAREIISQKADITEAVIDGLNAGMRDVAEKYDKREIYLPQVLASANTFYAAFEILRPFLPGDTTLPGRKLIIGVVEGDIHDIGKNLIKVMIGAHGYECIDLGRDVPTDDFIDRIIEMQPDYVAVSTLMTPTLISVREILRLMEERGVRKDRKVMVGGGQVSQNFADEIGADFYGVNDRDTVAWMKLQEKKDVGH
jgi:dimethylamine corrinoid protein